MKHCWHPNGHVYSDTFGRGPDKLVCCWCGVEGLQYYETETALTSGHGQYYLKTVKVRRPVESASDECTEPRQNQVGAPRG